MIDFRSAREQRASAFDFIQVRIASHEEIRGPRDAKEREHFIIVAATPPLEEGNRAIFPISSDG